MSFKSRHFRFNDRLIGASKNAPPMKRPEFGYAVRLVQQALIDLGYPLPVSTGKFGSPDGIYGGETKKKVRELQSKEKLGSKDGIVGKNTIGKMDDLLFARRIRFHPLPDLPPGSPGGSTDLDADARTVVLAALGTGNPLRHISWTLEWHQLSTDRREKATILGHHYDAIGKRIFDDAIAVEIHPGISAAALYLPNTRTLAGVSGTVPGNTLILSRPLRFDIADRSMIIHEATHAICDARGRIMNALFSEVLAFVAEGLFCRKVQGGPKTTAKAYKLADEVAQALLSGKTPDNDLIDDLSLAIRSHETYGPFTHGTVQYNGIPH